MKLSCSLGLLLFGASCASPPAAPADKASAQVRTGEQNASLRMDYAAAEAAFVIDVTIRKSFTVMQDAEGEWVRQGEPRQPFGEWIQELGRVLEAAEAGDDAPQTVEELEQLVDDTITRFPSQPGTHFEVEIRPQGD